MFVEHEISGIDGEINGNIGNGCLLNMRYRELMGKLMETLGIDVC